MSTSGGGQSGGVLNNGSMNTGGGSVVGGNMTVTTNTTAISKKEIENALQLIAAAIEATPPEQREQADAKLEQLKIEAAKADKAEDGVVAKLVKGLVALAPSAVSAVVSAFATPLLSGLAGPVTKHVLEEIGEGGS